MTWAGGPRRPQMNRPWMALTALGLLALGCERKENTTATPPQPDNTAVNQRDADGTTPTPVDQPNNAGDLDLVAKIRDAVTDDHTLSTNAHNCKIIVSAGTVTLRGVVDSQAEKEAVEAKARAVAGVTSVDNQLEVKAP
jgi:hyperosmotically inducible periplasmic protein